MMNKLGIDVSYHQGSIDWKKVAASGIEFAIIRAGYGKNTMDKEFIENIVGATTAGIKMIGIYWFIYAAGIEDAKRNAEKCHELIKLYKNHIDLKVWADWEYDSDERNPQTKEGRTAIVKTFLHTLEEKGYDVGLYANPDYLENKFEDLSEYPLWLAKYSSDKGNYKPYIWQYSSKGSVPGINGNVDMNILYEENASIKKEKFPTLRKGNKGYYVGYVQEKLNSLGYICGSVDRSFGSKTEMAVKEFQRRNSLKVDGVVGPNTWKQLNSTHSVMNPIAEYSLKKDGNKKISANFTVKEFACKDFSDKILIDTEFVADKLQKIRSHFKAAVTINSGYRTASYNKKIDGAANSYHVKGQAFDIVVKGKTPAEVAAYAYSIGVPGIIQYNTFVHVDSRAGKYYARNDNGKVTKVSKF